MPITFGSLFAGIGGFELGFERAGMQCLWQVEKDEFCQRVLAKHWPDVRRWDDVRTFPPTGDWGVDVICGGFPCQDVSNIGKRAGIGAERSGLWSEFARIVRVVRPRVVVVENVAALLHRGMGRVLGDLAEIGLDARWGVLSACAFGAPHARERVFLIAHPKRDKQLWQKPHSGAIRRMEREQITVPWDESWRSALTRIRGVGDGVPRRVERTDAIRNAVAPPVAEWIGRRIVEAMKDVD